MCVSASLRCGVASRRALHDLVMLGMILWTHEARESGATCSAHAALSPLERCNKISPRLPELTHVVEVHVLLQLQELIANGLGLLRRTQQ